MMNIYTLTIGYNDKNTKNQEYSNEVMENTIYDVLMNDYGIYALTATPCKGVFTHDDGTIVKENSLRVEIATEETLPITHIVRDLKTALNQECIMVTEKTEYVRFL